MPFPYASQEGGFLKFACAAILATSLAGCGGDDDSSGGPGNGNIAGDDTTQSISPEGGEISATTPVVITFTSSMDPGSLQLDGSLAGITQAEWSESSAANDTLTLTPADYWAAGEQTLVVDVDAADGGGIEPIETAFDVLSAFATFHQASIVIGQQDFAGGDAHQGNPGASANTLDLPMGPVAYASDADILFIPDNGSSRVLGFYGIPDANNVPADFVIGQPDFNSSSGGTDASTYRNPQWVTTEHDQLLVTDSESRRVLVYNGIPETGPVDADIVVGQSGMTARVIACDQSTVYTTHGHFVTPAGKLFVSDADNNRVMVWNAVPSENGVPADMVLGQPSFTTCTAHDEAGGSDDMRIFNHPVAIWSDDQHLVITDNENHRVLIWNEMPTESFAEPDVILGQETFETTAPNDVDQDGITDDVVSASVMNLPWDVSFHRGQLFVSDYENNRVLVWNGWPESNFEPADIVIGQEDFESNAPNAGNNVPGASGLDGPRGAIVINDQLFVTDTRNSRVLIYNAE